MKANKLIFSLFIISVVFIAACGLEENNILPKNNEVDIVFKNIRNEVPLSRDFLGPEIIRLQVDIANNGEFDVNNGVIYFTDTHAGIGGISNDLPYQFSIASSFSNGKRISPSILSDQTIEELYYEFPSLDAGSQALLTISAKPVYEVALNDIFIEGICIQSLNSKECNDRETYSSSKIKNSRAPLMIDKIEKINVPGDSEARVNFNFYLKKPDRKGFVVNDLSAAADSNFGFVNFIAELDGNPLTCSGLNYFGSQLSWDKSKTDGVLRCEVQVPIEEFSYSILTVSMDYIYSGAIKSASVKFIKNV